MSVFTIDGPPQDAVVLLGDAFCVEGDCLAGEQAIVQLEALFAQVGRPPAFAGVVAALRTAFDSENSKWSRKAPFSPSCCTIKQIGVQASVIADQLAAGKSAPALSAGFFGPPQTFSIEEFLPVVRVGVYGAVVLALLYGAIKVYGAVRAARAAGAPRLAGSRRRGALSARYI